MKRIITYLVFIIYSYTFSQSVQPFLDTIVSQFPNVRDLAMTQNQNEVLFSAQSVMGDISVLIGTKKVNDLWQQPEVVSFSGRYFDLEPFFATDGLTLFFVSNRPLDQTSETIKDFDIWYVERKTFDSEWSQPVNIGAPINTDMDEFYPAITDSKNIYFTLDNLELKQKDNIYVSEYINGTYKQPKQLGKSVNSEGYEFNAFVASDETYLIYTGYNKEGGFGSGDLYMSTKSENGEWNPSKNMGSQINTPTMEYCPFVDEITNTLYFTSKRNALKPTFESQVHLDELLKTFNSYENGSSRLYKVSLDGISTMKNP